MYWQADHPIPTGRRRPAAAVLLLALALILASCVWAPPRVKAETPLTPVRHLVAATSGDVATISWRAPTGGHPVRYQVEAMLDGADYGTRIVSGTSIKWDRIPFGHSVYFQVTPIGPDGPGYGSGASGPANLTGVVSASNSYCKPPRAGDCVVVDTADGQGPESLAGSGLLHGTVPAGNRYAQMLHLGSWRIASNNSTEYRDATSYVPSTHVIEVLSDGWYNATDKKWLGRWYVADPWANWSRYTSFIEADVRGAVSRAENPYWEIQNEPLDYPYSPAHPPTRALVEEQYLYAYRAIKAVDPSARVIGPSIEWAYENPDYPIDMKSFIPFASAHGMRLAAIAWHDNTAVSDSSPVRYAETPQEIRDQAEQVRELIKEYPGVGHPALFVDENSSPSGQFSPGWDAGYLAEQSRATIALADRACWASPGEDGSTGCFGPNLDELLHHDGKPAASFWTMADYASMSGTRVWSDESDSSLSSLAVRNGSGVTRILLGRHQTCSGWTAGAQACPVTTPPRSLPTSLDVLVPLGATSARVTVQQIPDVSQDLPTAPRVSARTIKVERRVVRLLLPGFADGAAYFITVSPNSLGGGAPASGNLAGGESPPAAGPSTPARLVPETAGQTAPMLGAYQQPLSALVTDQYGDPLAHRQVMFRIPAGYGTFAGVGRNVAVVETNIRGIATSPPIRAGARSGPFAVYAGVAVADRPSTYFHLTNTL